MAQQPFKIVENNLKQLPCNIEAEQAVIASILVSNDIYDEISPFRELYHHTGGADRYEYNKTVPIYRESEGSEAKPLKGSPGLVTKGVTTFLLRERDLVSPAIVTDNFYGSKHQSSMVGNIVIDGSSEPVFDVAAGLISGVGFFISAIRDVENKIINVIVDIKRIKIK